MIHNNSAPPFTSFTLISFTHYTNTTHNNTKTRAFPLPLFIVHHLHHPNTGLLVLFPPPIIRQLPLKTFSISRNMFGFLSWMLVLLLHVSITSLQNPISTSALHCLCWIFANKGDSPILVIDSESPDDFATFGFNLITRFHLWAEIALEE
jgi:hypothetical protein